MKTKNITKGMSKLLIINLLMIASVMCFSGCGLLGEPSQPNDTSAYDEGYEDEYSNDYDYTEDEYYGESSYEDEDDFSFGDLVSSGNEISWDEASQHIGEEVDVTGPVESIGYGNFTIIKLGYDYENSFQICIMYGDIERLGYNLDLIAEGQTVTVHGTIVYNDFYDVPEINLSEDPTSQLYY